MSPQLTHLSAITPVPSNRSISVKPPQRVREALRPEGGWVAFLFRKARNIFVGEVGNTSHSTLSSPLPSPAVSGASVPSASDADVEFQDQGTAGLQSDSASGEAKNCPHNSTTCSEPGASEGTENQGADLKGTTYPVSSTGNETVLTNFTGPLTRLQRVTREQWRRDTVPFRAPRALSLRTVQLANVGFPVDHLAMLWCHQVLSSVTQAMHQLLHPPSTSSSNTSLLEGDAVPGGGVEETETWREAEELRWEVFLTSLFSLRSEHVAGTNHVGVIPPVAALLRREGRAKQWQRATDADRAYMFASLSSRLHPTLRPVAAVWTLAVLYVTSHLATILTCYIILCVLLISVPLWRSLADINPWYAVAPDSADLRKGTGSGTGPNHVDSHSSRHWSRLHPRYHLHVDLLYPVLRAQALVAQSMATGGTAPAGRPLEMSKAQSVSSIPWQLWVALGVLVCSKVLVDSYSVTLFLTRYGLLVEWAVSYAIALGVRAGILQYLILQERFVSVVMWLLWKRSGLSVVGLWVSGSLSLSASRLKRWRRKQRGVVGSIVDVFAYLFSSIVAVVTSVLVWAGTFVAVLLWIFKEQYTGAEAPLTLQLGLSCILYIASFALLVFALILCVARTSLVPRCRPVGRDARGPVREDLFDILSDVVALYLPLVALALPLLSTSWSLLHNAGSRGAVDLLEDILLTNLRTYTLILLAALAHVAISLR